MWRRRCGACVAPVRRGVSTRHVWRQRGEVCRGGMWHVVPLIRRVAPARRGVATRRVVPAWAVHGRGARTRRVAPVARAHTRPRRARARGVRARVRARGLRYSVNRNK